LPTIHHIKEVIMKRFIVYYPEFDSYIRITGGGWTSGHDAEAVNSYYTLENARKAVNVFPSLSTCQIFEIEKTIKYEATHSLS